MGTFSASLRAMGDVKTLPATVEISDGRLTIAAGSTEIGSWSLDEVTLEEIPTGYRLAAEGDQILIELKDISSFSTALANGSKKKRGLRRKGDTRAATAAGETPLVVPTPPVHSADRPAPEPSPRPAVAAKKTSAPRREKRSKHEGGSRVFEFIDTLLINAKKRFGANLPDFMFSRAMFFIALGAIATMIVLPGVFSIALMIGGVLMVLFGAIVYGDSVLASKFLPGRSTPTQALLLGLVILFLGVLVGAIAR